MFLSFSLVRILHIFITKETGAIQSSKRAGESERERVLERERERERELKRVRKSERERGERGLRKIPHIEMPIIAIVMICA